MPKTYVLVHGLAHGGWCWKRVADHLRAAGHDVYTPTQTGLGERCHLLSADIGISIFVEDLVNVIEYEEISDIILVGHSFGGMAITGVADMMPERIRHIVYLDAIVPQNGQSVFSQLPESVVNERMKMANDYDGGKSFPPFDPEAFEVTDPDDIAWLKRRLTPHPVKTYVEPISLRNPPAHNLNRTYIRCTKPGYPPVETTATWLKQQSGWNYIELASGHDAPVTAPADLTEILLNIG
jgi:pimeloyl-ACP methyl ester carboxylesterase